MDRVVFSTVCYCMGHCTSYEDHFLKLDVQSRKLWRSIVAPPLDTNGSLEWHDVRVQNFTSAARIRQGQNSHAITWGPVWLYGTLA